MKECIVISKNKLIEFSLSKKRIIAAAIFIVISIICSIAVHSTAKFALAIVFLFAFGGVFHVKINWKHSWIIMLAAALAAAVADVVLVQMTNDFSTLPPVDRVFLGAESAFMYCLVFYNIFLYIFPRKAWRAEKCAIITNAFFLVSLGIINWYTFSMRGKGISPTDILAINTAMNVIEGYTFVLLPKIPKTLLICLALAFILTGIEMEAVPRLAIRRVLAASCLVLVALHIHSALDGLVIKHWKNVGIMENGLILNLTGQLNQEIIIRPEGYGSDFIQQMETEYSSDLSETEDGQLPNIVVIMNETFADMSVWGELDTSLPVMPYFDSMKENSVRGYALSSIVGGMTADSEFEFLSGNSMAFLSPSSLPFQQYIHDDVYSLERWLEKFGYTSYFTHPAEPINWNRGKVYPMLGFENISFLQDYSHCEPFRDYITDEDVYENVIKQYEAGLDEGRQFLFAVTIQNHSPYDLRAQFDEPVSIGNFSMAEADQYLSLLHMSDTAFRDFIDYFENREEPVIVLMYGDHQPKIAEAFAEKMLGRELEGLQENMLLYYIPFVIWANYDIEEQDVGLTSLNFLSNYLLETAGIALPPYNEFLQDMQDVIPAMNAYGYWSESLGRFAEYSEARGEEKEWLHKYEILQYNSIFDKKNRSEVFFCNE